MIKVNLLIDAKREPSRKTPVIRLDTIGASQNVVLITVLVFSLSFVGWRYYSLNAESKHLNQDIEIAKDQLKRVEKDREAILNLKSKKDSFQKQIDIITSLKNNQQVPVRLLDEISRNLPDFLWLVSLQEKGNQLTFSGKATTPNAYANFYNNLHASPYFYDVGRVSYTANQDDVTFSLSARFMPHGSQAQTSDEGQQGE